MRRRIRNAVGIIRRASRLTDQPLIVMFSGGKDSLTCLSLAREAGLDVIACYMDSGMDLPGNREFVEDRCAELDVELLVSHPEVHKINHAPPLTDQYSFADYVRYYRYFPVPHRRWCSTRLKQRPCKVMLRQNFGRVPLVKIVGVRIQESERRRYIYGSWRMVRKFGYRHSRYIRKDKEISGTFMCYPILDWTKRDIEEYLDDRGIQVHHGYKAFGVSGCKWCPVYQPEIYERVLKVYPRIYNDIIRLEREIMRPSVVGNVWLRDIRKKGLSV